jgi:pimeloyl-ACP methyl ester carboxylesterase
VNSAVAEEIITTSAGLVGIVTHPTAGTSGDLPGVVILNAGNMHRVGNGRISVTLARRLAGQGHVVLRFDHAGVGDSAPRRDATDLGVDETRAAEIADVLTLLERQYGVRQFVVYGLCSGARDGFRAAVKDARIVGLVQIDGFAYRNVRYHLTHFVRRLREPRALPRWLGRMLSGPRSPEAASLETDMWVQEWKEYPPRAEVEDGYRKLVERGVAMYVVYTGSWQHEYNYRRQFLDTYRSIDFGDLLTLSYLPDAEHTLPDPKHRTIVLEGVCAWMSRIFGHDRQASP